MNKPQLCRIHKLSQIQKVTFYEILWLFKTIMNEPAYNFWMPGTFNIVFKTLDEILLWNNSLMKTQVESYLIEGPSRVPWFRCNWLQQALVESIQQLFFCLYENIQLHSFVTWFNFADSALFLLNSAMLCQRVCLLHENTLYQSLCSCFHVD